MTALRTALLAVGIALLGLSASASATAAPPANDDFANAQELTFQNPLPIEVEGTTVDATVEPDEPEFQSYEQIYYPNHSVWYEWQPDFDGEVRISACESPGMLIGVYTGDQLGALTRVLSYEYNSYPQPACDFTFPVDDSQTYRVAIDNDNFGGTAFELIIRELNPPPNDDFANADDLSGLEFPIEVDGTTVDATPEPLEPDHLATTFNEGYGPERSVWFKWQPAVDGPAAVDTCRDSGPPMVVYSGEEYGGLSQVAGSYAGPGPFIMGRTLCVDTFWADADDTYRIAVDWYSEGPFHLALREPTAPGNDDFGEARGVEQRGTRIPLLGNNVESTREPAEPVGSDPYSVWFEWRPVAEGRVTLPEIPGCEGNPDTQPKNSVQVYTGTRLQDLTFIEAGCGPLQRFMADEARTYVIRVGSYRGEWGGFSYTLRQELSCRGRDVTIGGTRRADRLRGTPRPDVIASFGGRDRIRAAGGHDLICGGTGNDTLRGGRGKDRLVGGRGSDLLIGGPGRDRLLGGPGRDRSRR